MEAITAEQLQPYVAKAHKERDAYIGARSVELLGHPWARLQNCPVQAAEIIGRILESDDCLNLLEQRARLMELIADEANREANREWSGGTALAVAIDLYRKDHK